ncbi:hypothetical protein TKK_0005821 [Trichogramma kaykai]
MIQVQPKKRVRLINPTVLRKCSVIYSLNVEAKMIQVCRKCFLETFGETTSFIKEVSNKLWNKMNNVASDFRGKRVPKNKTSQLKLDEVNQHIKMFPAYESHYSRTHTSKKYLPVGLNCKIMHRLYSSSVENPCLPTPKLDTSVSFYKRPLWTFNLTVNSPGLNTKCFMWHECIANRVLEPGHTQMECDSDHALIERAKKKYEVKIEHPNEWYNLVRNVRLTRDKEYQVIEMKQSDFMDFNGLFKTMFTMRTVNEAKEKFGKK